MLVPLVLAITLTLSASPVFAWEDLNEFGAEHRANVQRDYEQQRAQWAAEEQAAQYRNEQATRERNQPSTYESSPSNPNAPFGVFGADGSYQVCQKGSGNSVYCF